MGVLADTLGGKIAGDLIRASDWNSLIDAIEGIEASLSQQIEELSDSVDTRFAAVDTAIAGLQETVQDLETRVETAETNIASLRQRFRRVTMETAQTDFVIGELAEITARITDIDGGPLDLSDAATRPWIDFVTAWGQLKPVPGFESRGGAGDRTISVRVNAEGIARVLLRAEHAEGFSDDAEAEVAAALTTVPAGSQMTVKEAILSANTPMQAREQGAFRILTQEYARNDAISVRNYVDAYYVKTPTVAIGKFVPNFFHRWRDYRSTVIAIAKTDADPRTPDPSLGSCSIQVNFRDWIGPWLVLDFFDDIGPLVADYVDIFRGNIAVDFSRTLERFQDQVQLGLLDKGILGKQKHTQAILRAVQQIQVTDPPPFLGDVTQIVANGLVIQQATDFAQIAAIGVGEQPIAFQAFTESNSRAESRIDGIQHEITGFVEEQLGKTQEELLFQVDKKQADFRTELFAEDGAIKSVARDLQVVVGQVSGFQAALNAKADIQTLARFLPG